MLNVMLLMMVEKSGPAGELQMLTVFMLWLLHALLLMALPVLLVMMVLLVAIELPLVGGVTGGVKLGLPP